jgi:cell division protein FtsB
MRLNTGGIFTPGQIRAPVLRKIVIAGIVAVILLLQYPLWFGNGGFLNAWHLRKEIEAQKLENTKLRERNEALEAEVEDLKQGLAAIEERARHELGMTRKGETYYRVLENPPTPGVPPASQ